MNRKHFDVIIAGLGAHGSAAAYQLSKSGLSILGIDRFTPPHTHGSSHGQSRIIRQAYHENPLYVPFVREAYRLWEELESITGRSLLLKTGGIVLGAADADFVTGAKLSAETFDLPFDYLGSEDIRKRFPALKVSEDTVAVLDHTAGILFPEMCIEALLGEAAANGGVLQYNERILQIIPQRNSVEVITEKDRYTAARIILSAGAWLNSLLPGLSLPLGIERQVLHWFRDRTSSERFRPDNFPIFIWEYAQGQAFYGFPDLGDGIKAAFHYGGRTIGPDELTNDTSEEEVKSMSAILERYLNIDAVYNFSTTCMYTDAPDENFIIDTHPAYQQIIIASPCSGHGFKFASVIGKILGDMVTESENRFDLSPFRIERLMK